MKESKSPVKELENLLVAKQAISMGARPVIAAILADVTPAQAKALFVNITGGNPPRGMLPSSPDWFFQNNQRIIAAASFMTVYRRTTNGMPNPAPDLFVNAFRIFLTIGESEAAALDIGRAWILMRLTLTGFIKERRCGRCKAVFINLKGVVFNQCDCPVCSLANNR